MRGFLDIVLASRVSLVVSDQVVRMLVVKTKQNASCKTKVVRMLVVKTAIAVVLVMALVL